METTPTDDAESTEYTMLPTPTPTPTPTPADAMEATPTDDAESTEYTVLTPLKADADYEDQTKTKYVFEGNIPTALPAHHTQGAQAMDATNGPIHAVKRALGPILSTQYHAKDRKGETLTKADMMY